MNEIIGFLKGLVGGGLLLITLLFVAVGTILGFTLRGAPDEETGLAWIAIALPVLFIAGGACYWAAVRMFRGNNPQPHDLRSLLGGYPLLFAGIISFIGAAFLLFSGEVEKPEWLVPPAIALGICWLWAALKLFRGNNAPVANLWCYLAGNFWLAGGMFIAFGAHREWLENPDSGWIYLRIFASLYGLARGSRLLLYGKPPSEKSVEEMAEDEREKEAMTKRKGELAGFLVALFLVVAGSAFVTVRERLTADNCMRILAAEDQNYNSDQREQLRRELEKGGDTHDDYGGLFVLDIDNCKAVRREGKRNIDIISDSIE